MQVICEEREHDPGRRGGISSGHDAGNRQDGKGTEKNRCCGSSDPETYAFFLQYAVFPVCFLRRCRRMETGFISAVTADAQPPMIQRPERQTLNVYRLFRYVHPEITEIPAASA
jgi:hypothetical protein